MVMVHNPAKFRFPTLKNQGANMRILNDMALLVGRIPRQVLYLDPVIYVCAPGAISLTILLQQ